MNVSVVLDIYSKFHHLINTLIVPFLAPNETYALSHWTHLNDVFYHERNEILHDIISISRCFWSNRNVNGIYRTKAIPLDGRVDLCEFQWNWIDKKKNQRQRNTKITVLIRNHILKTRSAHAVPLLSIFPIAQMKPVIYQCDDMINVIAMGIILEHLFVFCDYNGCVCVFGCCFVSLLALGWVR